LHFATERTEKRQYTKKQNHSPGGTFKRSLWVLHCNITIANSKPPSVYVVALQEPASVNANDLNASGPDA